MKYAIVMLTLALLGCNHYDQSKAFGVYPDRHIGMLDVYVPKGTSARDKADIFEVMQYTLGGGTMEGHWAGFERAWWWSVPQPLQRHVKVYVHKVSRLTGIARGGVLGYYDAKSGAIHVVMGQYRECPDLTVQLHRAFVKPKDTWYQDLTYWTPIRNEQKLRVEDWRLARSIP